MVGTVRLTLTIVLAAWLAPAAVLGQGNNVKLDLNGLWRTDQGEIVRVTQAGQQVHAVFLAGADCVNGGTRAYFIDGQLSGASLKGHMAVCTRSVPLVQDCKLDPTYETTFEATVAQNQITGTRFAEGWAYDEKDGHLTNCRRDGRYDRNINFALTRTTCDQALAQAKQDYKKWYDTYKEQNEAGDEVNETALKAFEDGQETWQELMLKQGWKQLPIPVMLDTASSPDDYASITVKAGTQASESYAEWAREQFAELARQANGLEDANAAVEGAEATEAITGAAEVGELLVELTDGIARQLTKLQEGQQASQQSAKIDQQSLDSLHKAASLQQLIRALEKLCGPAASPQSPSQDPAPVPSAGTTASGGQSEDLSADQAQAGAAAAAWSQVSQDAQATQKALTDTVGNIKKAAQLEAPIATRRFTPNQFQAFSDAAVATLRSLSTGAQHFVELQGHLKQATAKASPTGGGATHH